MEFVRNRITGRKKTGDSRNGNSNKDQNQHQKPAKNEDNSDNSNNDDDDDDGEFPIGPTIYVAPGQVKEDVHYMESRGFIDLSQLRFHAYDVQKTKNYNHYNYNYNYSNHNAFKLDIDGHNHNNNNHNRSDAIGNSSSSHEVESFVDIAVFQVPQHCTSQNCDLSKFGIGSLSRFGGTSSLSYLNLCEGNRLKLDHDLFTGHHAQLVVPTEGRMPNQIHNNNRFFDFNFVGSGFSVPTSGQHYEVLLANCDPNGKTIRVRGRVVFDLLDDRDDENQILPAGAGAGAIAILVGVAALVFAILSVLAVRVNRGTRSDFEREVYGTNNGNGYNNNNNNNNRDGYGYGYNGNSSMHGWRWPVVVLTMALALARMGRY
eukprot:jgi/Psemu1/70493/estExt_Genemark1.C_23270002